MARPQTITHVELARKLKVGVRTVLRWSAGSLPRGFPLTHLRKLASGRLALTPGEITVLAEVFVRQRSARCRAQRRKVPSPGQRHGRVTVQGLARVADTIRECDWHVSRIKEIAAEQRGKLLTYKRSAEAEERKLWAEFRGVQTSGLLPGKRVIRSQGQATVANANELALIAAEILVCRERIEHLDASAAATRKQCMDAILAGNDKKAQLCAEFRSAQMQVARPGIPPE